MCIIHSLRRKMMWIMEKVEFKLLLAGCLLLKEKEFDCTLFLIPCNVSIQPAANSGVKMALKRFWVGVDTIDDLCHMF